jgi:2-polyprenyl-3-methyl-5-hydroxy-6-metoxy-1,4-benzoquinol methylase
MRKPEISFENVPLSNVQEYWNKRPCNIRHSPKPVGSEEYFEEVRARKYFVEPHIPRLAEFQRWKDKKVLEIGCGIGTDTIEFAKNGAFVTAVDLSDESMKIAKQRADLYGLAGRIQFYAGSAEQLENFLPLDQYDLIYSFGVIHHTPHPESVLKQVQRYCAPGGTIKIMVYNRHSWKVFWILMSYGHGKFWKLRELVAKYSEAESGCPVTYTYSAEELQQLLERNGFQIQEIFADHIFPYRIADYVTYRYVKVWYFRWIPQRTFRWLERHFGWHLCVTAERSSSKR